MSIVISDFELIEVSEDIGKTAAPGKTEIEAGFPMMGAIRPLSLSALYGAVTDYSDFHMAK